MNRSCKIYYGGFLSASGGAYAHARLLNEALSSMSWSVEIVTLDVIPLPFRYLPHILLRLVNFFDPIQGYLVKGRAISLLFRLFKPPTPDQLVVFEDIYLAWQLPNPSLTILHAVWSDNLQGSRLSSSSLHHLKRKEIKLLKNHSSPIVSVSQPYTDYICTQHFSPFHVPHIYTVNLGVDVNLIRSFSTPRSSKNRYSLVYCGVCSSRKNLFFLLDIFAQVYKEDSRYSLTIIGDGPDLNDLKAYSKRLFLPVNFKGRLSRTSLLQHFSKQSIYIHTSTKESFSFSLLEAKLLGLTTVAYGDLEVPPEFVDYPVPNFLITSWSKAIAEATHHAPINDDLLLKYSHITMAQNTLKLVKPDPLTHTTPF